MSRSVVLRMRNFSDENCAENQNTHVIFNNFFFLENHAVYEVMWKNIVGPDRPQITIWRMRNAYMSTNIRLEYAVPIASPQQL